MTEHTNAIELLGLTANYRKRSEKLLENISFAVPRGSVLTILGPNGSGKTTLLNCILKNHTEYTGTILLNGKNILQYSTKEFAATAAYVPQLSQVNFDYTVEEFVLMGRNPHKSYFSQPNESDYAAVKESLDLLGIYGKKGSYMSEISGGERQLAYIARAVTQKPSIIIMDEPTSALDYSNQYLVIRILKELNAANYTILLTSHSPDYAFMLGGNVAMLFNNGEYRFGPVEEMMTEDNLKRLYHTNIKVRYFPEFNTHVCFRTD